MSKKVSSGSPGKLVRRKNKNGNYFYQERETGKRTSKQKWEKERKSISRKVTKNRQEKETRVSKLREESSPFPPGVDSVGTPKKRQKGAGERSQGKRTDRTLTGQAQDAKVTSTPTVGGARGSAIGDAIRTVGRPLVETPKKMEGEAIELDFDDDFIPFAIEGEDDTG